MRQHQILRVIAEVAKACPCDITLSQTDICVWKLVTVSADYHISEQHRVKLVYERKKIEIEQEFFAGNVMKFLRIVMRIILPTNRLRSRR